MSLIIYRIRINPVKLNKNLRVMFPEIREKGGLIIKPKE